jgi:mRNA-degrading endonuclease RelE of RelBE toxin-antitoxin system
LYRAVLTKRALKGLDKAPEHISKKASEAIEALQDSFALVKLFDVKKLTELILASIYPGDRIKICVV